MPDIVKFKLNGRMVEVEADPNAPLLYLLRNDLDFKGSRFGCGTGNCGSCTVIIDGQAVQSCTTPLWSVASASGQEIWTIEGLATDPVGALVRDAFLQEQAAQCGYCINGWIMTAAAFLEKNPKPTEAQIQEALTGIKCRCGTHMAIMRAIVRAAQA